jgi:uncharacterized protein
MGRLLLIVAIVIAVLWLLRRALAGPRNTGSQSPGASGGSGDLVSCAHCGVNLPRDEARSAGGRHYCSEEHWRAGPREG